MSWSVAVFGDLRFSSPAKILKSLPATATDEKYGVSPMLAKLRRAAKKRG
jgi:hypothetical protein